MEPNSEGIRERLLSRLPQPANMADYRREVAALLAKNEKGLRRETWGTGALWIFLVLMCTVFLVMAGNLIGTPKEGRTGYMAAFCCVFLIFGAVELLKHFINRARVELLKETKQIQLQVLELHEMWRTHSCVPCRDSSRHPERA